MHLALYVSARCSLCESERAMADRNDHYFQISSENLKHRPFKMITYT